MNAMYEPLPLACGSGDAGSATSDACGAAMAPLCSGGYDAGGTLRSALLAPHSNCSAWRSALQAAAVMDMATGGTPYLDTAMRTFCDSADGSRTPECACLVFPTVTAADWCHGSSLSCPQYTDGQCAAKEFAQVEPGGTSLEVVQFAGCNPYYCWLDACFAGPNAVLLPSDLLAAQSAPGACVGVCAQTVGAASTQIAPMPPGSFAPSSVVANVATLTSCGAAVDPAMLTAVPQTWTWSVNAVMTVPFAVTNDGDFPAQVTVATSSEGAMCALWPSAATIWPRSSTTFVLSCDQATVQAEFNRSAKADPTDPHAPLTWTFSPTFKLAYEDMAPGKTQGTTVTTDWLGINATIVPPAPPIPVTRIALPLWWWLTIVAVSLLGLFLLAVVVRVTHSVRRLMDALPPAPPSEAPPSGLPPSGL